MARSRAQGRVDAALLARLLDEPWFALPPPKSSGREQFHLDWLQRALARRRSAEDVQATLLELTARTVADALRAHQPRHARACWPAAAACTTRCLLARIAAHLPGMRGRIDRARTAWIRISSKRWPSRGSRGETLAGRPGNLPAVTGARGPRVLGVVYPR